jgi:uncharacterized membrane protein
LAAQTFQHPGVLVSKAQLDYVKSQVANQVQPFYSTFQKAGNSNWGSLTYVPAGPPAGGLIQCGTASVPDIGCTAEDDDATAAYTQALLWYITGNQTYANNAIKIMNTYAQNFKGYDQCGGSTCANYPLQAAWAAEKWPRAAEIIRYTNAGWASTDVQAFSTMLTTHYQPILQNGAAGHDGSWELSMIDGLMGIAVFANNGTLYEIAVNMWDQALPQYFYHYGDNPAPIESSGSPLTWYTQSIFDSATSGVAQETCHDLQDAQFGLAAALNAAETAYIQGLDLYTPNQARMMATLEYHAGMLEGVTNMSLPSAAVPVPSGYSGLCNGTYLPVLAPTFEIGYNAYHNRLGYSLPNTLAHLTNEVRPMPSPVDHHMMVYETLTHAGSAAAGSDFSITASTSSQTVALGNYAIYPLSISISSGANAAVSLTASGLPTGVTAEFSPKSVTGSGTVNFGAVTSRTTLLGTYTLTVTGTCGSYTHSVTLTLVVKAASDFSLAVSPASQTVTAGGSTSYAVAMTPVADGVGTVALSVSGLPTGAAASFSSASVTGSGQSAASVTTSSSTPAGTYPLTFTGASGSYTHTATATLVVSAGTSFSLTASAPSQTVTAGNYAVFPLAIAIANNATATINMTYSGLPAGATAGFTPKAVLVSGAVSFVAITTSSTPAGTYTLTVTGTSGSYTHSVTLTLVVQAAPNFSLTVSPASQTVTAGGSTSYALAVAQVTTGVGTVAVTVSGLPTGAAASFSSASLSAAGQSAASVTTSSSTPAGSYPLTFTAANGSYTHTATATLVVSAGTDFSLAAATASQTVTVGGYAIYPLSVSISSGASAAVSLTASGLPTGVTAEFSPKSVTGSGTVNFAAITSRTTPLGTYTLTVTGTCGSHTHSVTLTLVVKVASDFSLAVSPASQTVTAGGSTSYAVAMTPVSDGVGTVALSVSGLPTGAAASFSSASVTGAGQSAASVTTSSSTPAGTYPLTFTGASGSYTHTATATLVVSAGTSFSLTASAPSQTVTAGNYAVFPLAIAIANNATATINMTYRGLPAGATAGFTPKAVLVSGAVSFVVITGTSTPLGTYTLTVTGTSGSYSHSVTLTLVVKTASNFSLAVSPASQTVTAGGSTSYAVAATPVADGVGTIVLTASGLPAGATATFTPSIINAPGQSAVAITTSSSTPAGTYPLTFTAASGSYTHTATATLVVSAGANFSLTASAPSQTVTAGNYAAFPLAIAIANDSTATISMTYSGLPAGATAGFTPKAVLVSGTVSFVALTTSSTPAGTYTLTVTGTSGSYTHSVTLTLVVTSASVGDKPK